MESLDVGTEISALVKKVEDILNELKSKFLDGTLEEKHFDIKLNQQLDVLELVNKVKQVSLSENDVNRCAKNEITDTESNTDDTFSMNGSQSSLSQSSLTNGSETSLTKDNKGSPMNGSQNSLMNGSHDNLTNGLAEFEDTIPVEYELDFQNGEIEVRSPERKSYHNIPDQNMMAREKRRREVRRAVSEDEQLLRNQMKQLMDTFEQEKKRLDRRLDFEKDILRRQLENEFEFELEREKQYLSTIVRDLVARLDDIKREREEIIDSYEEEKRDLEQFYLKRMTEERTRMKQVMQKKILKAHMLWEKSKI